MLYVIIMLRYPKLIIDVIQTTVELTTQDDVDGPIPTVSMAVPHTMHPPADNLETIAENQRTHDIIMTMQSGSGLVISMI